MSVSYGIEVEHSKYALFLDPEKSKQNSIDVTTLADNQKRAVIKIFRFDKKGKTLIKTIELTNLPQKPAGKLKITCHAKVRDNRYIDTKFVMGGKTIHSQSVDTRREKKSRWWIFLLIFLLLAAGTAGIIAGVSRKTAKPGEPAHVTKQIETEKPTKKSTGTDAVRNEGKVTEKISDPSKIEHESTEQEPVKEENISTETETAQSSNDDPAPEPIPEPAPEPEPVPPPIEKTETVYFLPESAALLPAVEAKLQAFATGLPAEANITVIAVEGHCALYDTEASREELSYQRASSTAEKLRQLGFIFSDSVAVRGFGGKQPVTRDPEKQELNRRVEIRIKIERKE